MNEIVKTVKELFPEFLKIIKKFYIHPALSNRQVFEPKFVRNTK